MQAAAVALGLAGAFALGVWTGPSVTSHIGGAPEVREVAAVPPAETGTPSRVTPHTTSPAPRVPRARNTPITEAVLRMVKPLLNSGTNVVKASEGFRDAEQFVAVAHAAHNTGAPFVVLKDLVLTRGKSLQAAIREAAPQANAAREAQKATEAARVSLNKSQ